MGPLLHERIRPHRKCALTPKASEGQAARPPRPACASKDSLFMGVEDIEIIYRPYPEKRIMKMLDKESKGLSILSGPAYNTVRFL